jgi:hypothetical protein
MENGPLVVSARTTTPSYLGYPGLRFPSRTADDFGSSTHIELEISELFVRTPAIQAIK